ncbi:MAG: hypothetical protein JSR90_07875 [Proteobacteria bacterium]|nr:hypothetical protein [Pseudomonadota bacterium]
MATIEGGRQQNMGRAVLASLVGVLLLAGSALAEDVSRQDRGWKLEPGVNPPSYAVIEPASSNLNTEALVLTCEPAGDRRVLQFQLYLSESGPLMPVGADPRTLRHDPRAEMVIDGHVYPVGMYFAEDFVVLADAVTDRVPSVSNQLLDSVEHGKTMVLRFSLLARHDDKPQPSFDGEATIDLGAAHGGAAVASVRRCVEPEARPSASAAFPQLAQADVRH